MSVLQWEHEEIRRVSLVSPPPLLPPSSFIPSSHRFTSSSISSEYSWKWFTRKGIIGCFSNCSSFFEYSISRDFFYSLINFSSWFNWWSTSFLSPSCFFTHSCAYLIIFIVDTFIFHFSFFLLLWNQPQFRSLLMHSFIYSMKWVNCPSETSYSSPRFISYPFQETNWFYPNRTQIKTSNLEARSNGIQWTT